MANGAVCSRMYTQLVMTFRHPFIKKPHILGFKIQKMLSFWGDFCQIHTPNMAQVAHLRRDAPLFRIADKPSAVKLLLRLFL